MKRPRTFVNVPLACVPVIESWVNEASSCMSVAWRRKLNNEDICSSAGDWDGKRSRKPALRLSIALYFPGYSCCILF